MVRKQIYIEAGQQKTLKRLARNTGKAEAEIIREALDEHIRVLSERENRMAAWRAIEATVASLPKPQLLQQKVTGTNRGWKREDLYDRDERASSNRH